MTTTPPMRTPATADVLVLGGGVIGLSIAYDLAGHGLEVTLLDRGRPGREASWAGAGVLPPASWYVDHPALDAWCQAAAPMHAELSARLREETGVDDEYWPCGAEYQTTDANHDYVDQTLARWRSRGVDVRGPERLVPGEAQVRNPRRLKALLAACRVRGVRVVADVEAHGFERCGEVIDAVRTSAGRFSAGAYCLAAGCWTPRLAAEADTHAPGEPVRGQMLLLRPTTPTLDRIVHRYPYYAVPRRDGRVLVGATLERAGFANQTTAQARADLLAAAAAIEPSLTGAAVEGHWAGLRPASADRLPQIGPLPGLSNAWVAAGHHRSGLQLAPPTAELISAMIRGERCDLPSEAFDPARFAPAEALR